MPRPASGVFLAAALLTATACSRATRAAPERAAPRPAANRITFAWWVTARFAPSDPTVEGVPVGRLDTAWVAATPLSADRLPAEARREPGHLNDPAFGFRHEGDFNGDGRRDLALVGVYRARRGTEGKFLVVLTRTSQGAWERAFVAGTLGPPGFSVLQRTDSGLVWWDCMACDVGAALRWDGTAYRLQDLTCCPQDRPSRQGAGPAVDRPRRAV
jgi:hypothetical protein